MRRVALAAVTSLCLVLAGGARAHAETATQRFDAASGLLARGEHKRAAELLLVLAEDEPQSTLAADALFTAAGLLEEKLGEPLRAARIYRRLLDRYPDSRTALAASRRLADLKRGLGPDGAGAAALAIWNDVMARFPERSAQESIGIVEKLIKDHAAWTGRPRAIVWLATLHHRRGELSRALERYREAAAAADPEVRFDALLGAGMVAMRMERFAESERYLLQLAFAGAPGRERARDDALARLGRARLRARLYDAAYVVLLVTLLGFMASLRTSVGSWRGAAAALKRPPLEVAYMVPIAAIFVAASFTAHYAIAPAVIIITSGGLGITWISGVGLRAAGGGSRLRGALHLAGSFVSVVALVYIALQRTHLIDMIIETVRFGPDV